MLSQAQEEEEEKSSDQASLIREEMIEKLKNPMTGLSAYERRKAELQLKINQSIKMNNTAVLDEQQRLTDPLYERKKAKEEYFKEPGEYNLDDIISIDESSISIGLHPNK